MFSERCLRVPPAISFPGLCFGRWGFLLNQFPGCLRLTIRLQKPGKETGLCEIREELRWNRSLSVCPATALEHLDLPQVQPAVASQPGGDACPSPAYQWSHHFNSVFLKHRNSNYHSFLSTPSGRLLGDGCCDGIRAKQKKGESAVVHHCAGHHSGGQAAGA